MSSASRVLPTPPGPVSVTIALRAQQPQHLLAVVLPADHRAVRRGDPPVPDGAARPPSAPAGHLLLQLGQRGPRVEPGLVGQPPSERLGGAPSPRRCDRPSPSARTCSSAVRSRSGDAAAAAAASTATSRSPSASRASSRSSTSCRRSSSSPTDSISSAGTDRNSTSAGPRHSSSAAWSARRCRAPAGSAGRQPPGRVGVELVGLQSRR